ncbi:uncharacterized protein LOC136089730 [Hydra vulgaris]|uniref:Uncharacterized protein LOC136089730 n=1 Tax=Hydra vulgaris TaxID=6087 RepID=A0ABM4DBX2_HYDVU
MEMLIDKLIVAVMKETRQNEISNRQNARYAARQAANNSNPDEESVVRRVENNHCRNERDRLRQDEINSQQNTRYAARYEKRYCISRSNTIPDYNYLGEMNYICQHCGAKKSPNETHFLCCHNGKNKYIMQTSPFPQDLQDLFNGNYADRKANQSFLKYIRNYNACLSFASFKANVIQPMNYGPPCFRICGQVFHSSIGNLRPNHDVPPTYCQLYIYDPLSAVNFRMQQRGNDLCLNDLMFRLQTIIREEKPFALAFKNMAEVEDEGIHQAAIEGRSVSVVKMSLLEGEDRRCYNLPLNNDVAFVGEDGAPPASREVVIYPRGHPLKTISSMSSNLDPMAYPLFFPRGYAGWLN